MAVAPQIFHRKRGAADLPYHQYRWDGSRVICERVTPSATSGGAANKEFLQQWTGEEFLIANVSASAKNDFSLIWKQIRAETHPHKGH